MKKIILVLLMAICMATVVHAADKNITIYSFNVYSDGETIGTDWEDDTFSSSAGKTIDMQVRFENEWNNSITVTLEGTLSLTTEITRTKEITIDAGEKKVAILSFFIPADTKDGTFPLGVKYRYYTDNSSNVIKVSREYDLKIAKPKLTQDDFLQNLTNQMAASQEKTNQLVQNISTMSTNLATCQGELGKCKGELDNVGGFKAKYEAEAPVHAENTKKLAECEAQRTNMYTLAQMDDAKATAKEQQRNTDNTLLIGVVVAGAVWIFFDRKKRKIGDEIGKDPLRKDATYNTKTPWANRR